MKNISTLLICILICYDGIAQERFLRKSDSYLSDKDYGNATELVDRYEEKEGKNSQSLFMRFKILFESENSVNEIRRAMSYLEYVMYNGVSSKEKKESCESIGLCEDRLPEYRKKVEKKLYEAYKNTYHIDSLSSFISTFPMSIWVDSAKYFRSALAFNKAKYVNTEDAYQLYLDTYSMALYTDSAKSLLWEAAFKDVTEKNIRSAYLNYTEKYPYSPRIPEVKKVLMSLDWMDTKFRNAKAEYLKFIYAYPDSEHVPEANAILEKIEWNESQELGTIDAYQNFINLYPHSTHFKEADSTIYILKRRVEYDRMQIEATEKLSELRIYEAEKILSNIDSMAPLNYLHVKDSMNARIKYLKSMLKQSLGRYLHNTSGVEVIIVLGVDENDSSLYCKLKGFSNGVEINGVESDGSFQYGLSSGILEVNWEVNEFNKTMSQITIITLQGKPALKLANGTVYKKISNDYSADIKSTVTSSSKTSSSQQNKPSSKKIVCNSTWNSIAELTNLLQEITYEWKETVEETIRSKYREFIDYVNVTGANSQGILLEAQGNVTGIKYKVLWTCNGSIIVVDR
jgi:hypothetical protein